MMVEAVIPGFLPEAFLLSSQPLRFLLDSVDVSGVPVPKSLLQQLVSFYSRTTENPQGLNLDDAIDLPAGIREIRVQPGQAIVVQ